MKQHILFFCLLTAFIVCQAQNAEDYSKITMENKIYHQDILSAKLDKIGIDFALPIINLGEKNALILRFDDQSDSPKYLRYTLIHCTYDWKPTSDLMKNEYLGFFEDAEVQDYQTSINTIQFYTSYSITFPNNDVFPTKSGNYVIYVYDDDNNSPILTYRFYVVENLVNTSLSARTADDIIKRQTHQQIHCSINTSHFKILNPSRFLKVKTLQNNREDNAIVVSTPNKIVGNSLVFDKSDEILFEGGSEFRTFNIRTLRTRMEHVEKNMFVSGVNYTFLYQDQTRIWLAYLDDTDINGCYFVTSDDATDSLYGADYTEVHFFLQAKEKPQDVDFYVYGELSNWDFSPDYKMFFNTHKQLWECVLYLKTGYYNYTYVAKERHSKKGTFAYTEGNHWETSNRYNTFVYYQGDNLGYDRIISHSEILSFSKKD